MKLDCVPDATRPVNRREISHLGGSSGGCGENWELLSRVLKLEKMLMTGFKLIGSELAESPIDVCREQFNKLDFLHLGETIFIMSLPARIVAL